MGITIGLWPPNFVEVLQPRARYLAEIYGAVDGPVQDQLAAEAQELAGSGSLTNSDSSELARFLLSEALGGSTPATTEGADFGRQRSTTGPEWPAGPYRRCRWNPLHLMDTRTESDCLICDSVRRAEGGLDSLFHRDLGGSGWSGADLAQASAGRAPFLTGALTDAVLIKVHESGRAWLVDLHQDGTCRETPLGEGESWEGDWGCDSQGQLVIAIGSWQLAVVGAKDGLCPGLEFNAAEPDSQRTGGFAQSRFVVGVVDVEGDSHRGVKWVESNNVFRLTRADGVSWLEDGPLDECPLFSGAGWGSSGSWVAMRENSNPFGFDLHVDSDHGIDYWARLGTARPGLAMWRGTERWRGGEPAGEGEHSIVVAAVRPVAPSVSRVFER